MVVTVNLEKVAKGLDLVVISGGISTYEGEELEPKEVNAIKLGLRYIKKVYNRISPRVASLVDMHEAIVIEAAKIYKRVALKANVAAKFEFPPKLGSLSVAAVPPQLIRYVATPTATDPAYSDYALNTYDLTFSSAGETKYLFGSSANYWKGLSATKGPIMHIIFQDGLIEIGTTPKIDQVYLEYDGWNMIGTLFEPEVVKLPIETNKPIYQYMTHGVVVAIPDRGFKFAVMSDVAGKSVVIPVGISFYYVEKFKSLTWIS